MARWRRERDERQKTKRRERMEKQCTTEKKKEWGEGKQVEEKRKKEETPRS